MGNRLIRKADSTCHAMCSIIYPFVRSPCYELRPSEEMMMLDWASLRGKAEKVDGDPMGGAPAAGDPQMHRAGIALALGGGAARGWAHIGVLRALDEAGIRI